MVSGPCYGGEKTDRENGTEWISEEALADFRLKSATKQPVFEAFGWAVFRFEDVFYGVFKAKKSPEFVASVVTETEAEILLSGRSQIILNQSKRIFVSEQGTAKLRGEEYKIAGGRSRMTIGTQ